MQRRADAPGPRTLPIDVASKRYGTGTRARSIGDRLKYLVLAGLVGRVSVVVGERGFYFHFDEGEVKVEAHEAVKSRQKRSVRR